MRLRRASLAYLLALVLMPTVLVLFFFVLPFVWTVEAVHHLLEQHSRVKNTRR